MPTNTTLKTDFETLLSSLISKAKDMLKDPNLDVKKYNELMTSIDDINDYIVGFISLDIEGDLTQLKDDLKLKLNIDTIADDLISTDIDKPLSANMGKELKSLIDVYISISKSYKDIPTRDADKANLTDNIVVMVDDASADPTVSSGYAIYQYIKNEDKFVKKTDKTDFNVNFSTYLKKTDADTTYLKKVDADTTYPKKTDLNTKLSLADYALHSIIVNGSFANHILSPYKKYSVKIPSYASVSHELTFGNLKSNEWVEVLFDEWKDGIDWIFGGDLSYDFAMNGEWDVANYKKSPSVKKKNYHKKLIRITCNASKRIYLIDVIADFNISVDMSGKVDKVQGKTLSTNDYTNIDKSKEVIILKLILLLYPANLTAYYLPHR